MKIEFNKIEIEQIEMHGLDLEQIEIQINNFINGFPFIKITNTANINEGIIKLNNDDKKRYISIFEDKLKEGIKLLKFVPASGAASRMFKVLFDELENQKDTSSVEFKIFRDNIEKFAFYDDLVEVLKHENKEIENLSNKSLIDAILFEKGLNYSNTAKGLIKFHKYALENRSSFEEHLVEGAAYSKNFDSSVNIHFTINSEHEAFFINHFKNVKEKYESLFQVKYNISFSVQKASTDCIALNENNEIVKSSLGQILFRPGGHGALIENLNEQDADIIFIKNIDNVSTTEFDNEKSDYKKCLAGILINLQEQLFSLQKIFSSRHSGTIESAIYAEALNFIEKILNIKPPQNQYYSEKEELYHYILNKIFRPIRVCGMVKNENEPGGGPFFTLNADGSESLQIIESSQINFADNNQKEIANNAKYFNPVDIVCGLKDFEGNKYKLKNFIDHTAGFITHKSYEGNEIKVQELPGLWNGAMSDWNTVFVEVPLSTFSPVKVINDLLRKEHQSS